MIDNFFRLHEKNRKLNFDELFQKARYDFPQTFSSGAVAFEAGAPVEGQVKEALKQALSQLPASAQLDMAVVSVATDSEAVLQSVLQQLSTGLPGSTRVLGWATPTGGALSSNTEQAGAFNVPFGPAGGMQITLASLSAVNFFPFFVSEEQVQSWGVEPVAGLWEKLIGLGLNAAYKDPPVFFMFGRTADPFTVDLAVGGIDAVYPGTAKIGGAVYGSGPEVEAARLFGRLPGRDGAAIQVEEQRGIMGLVLSGDIRALVYATQGAVPAAQGARYVVEEVSADGRKVVAVRDEASGEVKTPGQLGVSAGSDLLLGLGGAAKEAKEEGADRWSFVSVRGSAQEAVRLRPGQWGVEQDGSIRLPRVARPGQVLSFAAAAGEGELDLPGLVKALRDEIENDWKKSELGVMRFRPSGVLVVKDSRQPALSTDALNQLSETLPNTYVGGFAAPSQLAPWDPETRSALLEGSLVLNVFACKAKRRDPREVRFDYRRPWHNSGLGSTGNVLDLCFDPLVVNEATGEVEVNRKAALIGTDVRVENMAWNVREERVVATGLLEALVWGKERELQFVREDAPLLNLMRAVMMLVKSTDPEVQAKARGRDVRAALLGSQPWAVVGEVARGSPLQGMALPIYDPVCIAKDLVGDKAAAAISVNVDQTYYGGKWQDLTDVKEAMEQPVIVDDLVLYPYQTYLAKLFKADGVTLSLQVLTVEDLQYQIKICASLFITPVLLASSLHQLRQASALLANTTGAILAIDDRDPVSMRPRGGEVHVAAAWLADPEVAANLRAAAEEPVVLVQGTQGRELQGEERAALQAVGVKGQFLSWTGDAFDLAARAIDERAKGVAATGLPPVGIF